VLFELPLTAWTRGLPPRRTIAVGYLLIGIGFALIGWAATIPALIFVVLVFTLGEMIAMPLASAYVVGGVPPEMRGRYMGAYGLVWALGLTLGPATGVRIHASSPLWLWIGCGLLSVIAAATMLRTKPNADLLSQ
jgi:dipeptide/tripeptide permease